MKPSTPQTPNPEQKNLAIKGSKDSIILTDITFNHLLENPNLTIQNLQSQYYLMSKQHPSHKQFFNTLKNNPKISLRKKISSFDIYNQMAKALRKKCKRYVMYADMRSLFSKVFDIAIRYMDSIDKNKMVCGGKNCGKFLKFNPRKMGESEVEEIDGLPVVEYPVLNHGYDFFHYDCCPQEIRDKII